MAEETNKSIDNYFPCELHEDKSYTSDEAIDPNKLIWIPVSAWKSGYIQQITYNSLNSYCLKKQYIYKN